MKILYMLSSINRHSVKRDEAIFCCQEVQQALRQQQQRQQRLQTLEGPQKRQQQQPAKVQQTQERPQERQERLDSRHHEPQIIKVGGNAKFHFDNTLSNFYAGKLADNLEAWNELTSENWVLHHIEGSTVELIEPPSQRYRPHPLRLSASDQRALDGAISDFIDWGIVRPWTASCEDIFVSTIFPVAKRDGSARVILNLAEFNEFVEERHFKMDTIHDAINLMTQDCFFASVDFKHAYYSVLIDPSDQKYMCFEWDGRLWCFCALPQGLRSAPRTFTKILKPVFANLREQGHTIIGYIDDSLIIEENKRELQVAVSHAVSLFDELGLTIHPTKSVLSPVQTIEFLGFVLDSRSMTVSLTQRKADKIARLAEQLLHKHRCKIQELAEFIGNVVAADPAVQDAALYYKGLEIARNKALRKSYGSYEAYLELTDELKADIQWWLDHIGTADKCVLINAPSLVTESDASKDGWGASFQGQSTGGDWTEVESELHINILELKAAFLTLQTYCHDVTNKHIRLKMDNTTAVACINKMASTKSKLFELIREIFDWARKRNVVLSAEYLPGHLNVVADRESRTHNLDMEWMLNQNVFQKVCHVFGTPDLDLFASRINHQLERYVSWRPDPHALSIDAFQLNWSHTYLYAFPPFSILPRLFKKLDEAEGVKLLLIAPLWTTRPWFPRLLQRLVAPPILLPRRCLHLPQDRQAVHRLTRMRLGVCLLSSKDMSSRDCRRKFPISSSSHGGQELNGNMQCTCKSGLPIVVQRTFRCWHQV